METGHRARSAARWAAILLAALAGAQAVRAQDAPAPSPAATEAAEPPLEGDAKKKHAEDLVRHRKLLRSAKDQLTMEQAIRELGALGTRAARDALIEYATTVKSQQYVEKSFDAIATIGDRVSIAFLCGKAAIRSPDFLRQTFAAEALGRAKNRRAVPALLDVMDDVSVKIEVQGAICLALAKTAPDDKDVQARLFKAADDKRDTIRANAVEALGYVNTEEAWRHLLSTLAGEKNTRVRAAAATGLGWTKRSEAERALRKAVDEDKSLTVRDAAVRALQEIGATAK
jgi:HEAT repeat protein